MRVLSVLRAVDGGMSVVPLRRGRHPRKCGSCRECCWRYPIEGTTPRKPKRKDCPHECRTGCELHNAGKPHECERYSCLWLSGLGNASDRPDKLGAIFDLPDVAHPQCLAVRISRTRTPLRVGRVKALATLLESFGNLLAFDTECERVFLELRFNSVLVANVETHRILARVLEHHHAWRLAAETMLAGTDLPDLPPRITPDDWEAAQRAKPDAELIAFAERNLS